MTAQTRGALLGSAATFAVLCTAVGLAFFLHGRGVVRLTRNARARTLAADSVLLTGAQLQRGSKLFDHNCASCHGQDARGDEGPNLHNLRLSAERIAKRIRDGVKGEMPRFGRKFNQADIEALITYLRTLKE